MSSTDRRDGSRLEVDDDQHCIECGLEIEIDTDGPNGIRWDPFAREWVAIEQCAACRAEDLLEDLAQMYATDVAFDVQVRGLDVESEVKR